MKDKVVYFFDKIFKEKIIIRNRVYNSILFLMPTIGIIMKNVLLQAYNLGENLYTPDFGKAVGETWRYWIYYAAISLGILSVSLLFKRTRSRIIYVAICNVFFTALVCADLIYTRSFFTMPSAVDMYIFKNFSGFEGGEVSSLICWYDIIILLDFVVYWLFVWKFKPRKVDKVVKKRGLVKSAVVTTIACAAILLAIPVQAKVFQINTDIMETEDPEKQSRYFSSLGYHIKDIYNIVKDHFDRELSAEEKATIDTYYAWKNEKLPNNQYASIFEGKNVLFLQIESLETFVINQTIDGQEITPNINKLTESAFVFNNIYEQVQGGNSSDADLMYTTSRLPVMKGSTFFRHADAKLISLPGMLMERGYETIYTQAVRGSFWNYEEAWKNMIGLDKFVGADELDMSGEKIGFTLNDKDYLEQVYSYLGELTEPYYAHIVCNSSHMPFQIEDESIKELELSEELDASYLGGYLQLCRYVDTQIGVLLDKMEAAGLLENTVIVVIGDHTGIHKYYEYSLEEWYDEYPWVEANGYYTVPLIVSCDTMEKKIESDILAGQIDVMPTLAYLLGIPDEEYMDNAMGRNLLKTNRSYAIFRDGTIYSEDLSEKDLAIVSTSYNVSESLFRSGQ